MPVYKPTAEKLDFRVSIPQRHRADVENALGTLGMEVLYEEYFTNGEVPGVKLVFLPVDRKLPSDEIVSMIGDQVRNLVELDSK